MRGTDAAAIPQSSKGLAKPRAKTIGKVKRVSSAQRHDCNVKEAEKARKRNEGKKERRERAILEDFLLVFTFDLFLMIPGLRNSPGPAQRERVRFARAAR